MAVTVGFARIHFDDRELDKHYEGVSWDLAYLCGDLYRHVMTLKKLESNKHYRCILRINLRPRDSYSTMIGKFVQYSMQKQFRSLLIPVDRMEFVSTPSEPNAYYAKTRNGLCKLQHLAGLVKEKHGYPPLFFTKDDSNSFGFVDPFWVYTLS